MSDRRRFPVPFARPLLPAPDEWVPFLAPAYEERWFSNGGPVTERFEAELASAGREAVAVASATAGLAAALMALEVSGPVVMPAFTFPATAHAALMAGCRPVFCDVDPVTWELDPAALESVLRAQRCGAVLHVRPFGFVRDLSAIEDVAAAAGVPLVVDAAAAFGGTGEDGVAPGGAGAAEVFSFHATKVMAIGEGGAVLAAPELAARIRRSINFGLDRLDVTGRALNGKLPDTTAAIGLAALRRLDEHVAARRAAVWELARAATSSGAVALPARPGRAAWQGLPVLAAGRAARDAALASLHAAGIEARIYYSPGLHRTSAFARYADGPLPVTDDLVERIVCLPVHADLAGERLAAVAAAVSAAFGGGALPAASRIAVAA